jgi:predicted nucleotidyltransferase
MADALQPREDPELAERLASVLPEASAIYLFGSVASGDARADSDLDLAVLGARPLPPERLSRARQELAELLRRDVDLVDLARAPTVLQAQIVSTGRVIRDLDPAGRERFETYVFSAYARLNEERRGILERIRAEGRIHGR